MKNIFRGTATKSGSNLKIELQHIGEGYYGEYDKNNSEDEPLFRIDVYKRQETDRRRWYDEPIYSTCTDISARVTKEEAYRIAAAISAEMDKIPEDEICDAFLNDAWVKAWIKTVQTL